MHRQQRKYDNRSMMVSAIAVAVCAIVYFFFLDLTKLIMRNVLEAKLAYFLVWVVAVVIFLAHYFQLRKKEVVSKPIVTKQFGEFADNVLGGVGYATFITTALTLLKGLFIQTFFNDKQYFAEFDKIDLMTVFVVMSFLLYYSIMKVVDIAKETYRAEHTEQVLIADKSESFHDGGGDINKKPT